MSVNKILVINTFGIGDVLFSTPLLKAIKRRYQSLSITYICNKRTEGILKSNPNISNIYIFEKDDYRQLWGESRLKCLKKIYVFIGMLKRDKYDVVIDMSLGYLFSLILYLFVRIPIRIGFNYRDRGRFLTHKLDIEGFNSKHVIEYYLELGKFLSLEAADKEMELVVAKEYAVWADRYLNEHGIGGGDKLCAIIPGCGASWGTDASYRRWSPWKFAAVADRISECYKYKVLIFGDKREIDICKAVKSEMKRDALETCGETSLAQFAALLNKCDLVVTNDGGPLHMAVALKRKTVSIFGPVDEKIYGPYPPSPRHLIVTAIAPCRPCYKNFKHGKCKDVDCLKDIGVDRVITAAETLIRGQ